MKSIATGHGYFRNDDRASGGDLDEDDLFGCFHCNALLKKSEWKMQGGFCTGCDKPICTHCLAKVAKEGCTPEIERITRAVNDHHRRQQNARVMGI